MHKPRSVREADVGGKRVLVRSDLNVPLEDGRVADDTRIRASLPTLQYLLEHDAKEVAVCSHLGRPKGSDPAFSMTPVARRLRELLLDERLDVLENTRFDPGETANDPDFARRLADDYELFVEDAFGSVHRAPETKVVPYHALPEGWLGLDIGPETCAAFTAEIAKAKTIFWNGPMGVFEWPAFAEGTRAVAQAVAGTDAFSVVGGADSTRALNELGLIDRVSWASTGGGAALELLEGKDLPGVAVIPQEVDAPPR